MKEAEADLGTAQAELVDAELQYQRYKTLVDKDLVARQDFDTAVARYKKAQAGVASAQAHIKVAQAAWPTPRRPWNTPTSAAPSTGW